MRLSPGWWPPSRKLAFDVGWCALHAAIFFWLFPSQLYGGQILGGDQLYYRYASYLARGEVPYLDFALEYPPLSLVIFALPRLFTASPFLWERLFTGQIFLWDLVVVFLLGRLAPNRERARTVYTAALLAIGPLVTQRFDMIPAVLTLVALLAHVAGHHRTAWLALLLGTLTKLYPAILAPLLALDLAARKRWRALWSGAAIFAAAALGWLLVELWVWPGMSQTFLGYHSDRPAEIESLYANAGLLAHLLLDTPATAPYGYGSVNLLSPVTDWAVRLAFPLTAAALAACYVCFLRESNEAGQEGGVLAKYALLCILSFILPNKVLSPQYLIWLMPLMPLSRSAPAVGFFVLAGVLTFEVYPLRFDALAAAEPLPIVLLTLRNVLLLLLAFALARSRSSWPTFRHLQLEPKSLLPAQAVLIVFALCLPLVFLLPSPPNKPVYLPPDLDGDGRVNPLEATVVVAGGVDHDGDGNLSDVERQIFASRGLDANGDGLVDGAEIRCYRVFATHLLAT